MADDEYKAAQADLKAAKARAKALRPWYRKKRFLLGIPLGVLIGLTILGSLVDDETETGDANTAVASSGGGGDARAAATASPTNTPTPRPTSTPAPTPRTPTPYPAMEEWEVCQAAERLVESHLRAPSTRDWVGNCYTGDNYRISRDMSGEHPVWTVLGQVDAQNGFGAMIRSTFMVEVTDRLNGRYDARVVAFE